MSLLYVKHFWCIMFMYVCMYELNLHKSIQKHKIMESMKKNIGMFKGYSFVGSLNKILNINRNGLSQSHTKSLDKNLLKNCDTLTHTNRRQKCSLSYPITYKFSWQKLLKTLWSACFIYLCLWYSALHFLFVVSIILVKHVVIVLLNVSREK